MKVTTVPGTYLIHKKRQKIVKKTKGKTDLVAFQLDASCCMIDNLEPPLFHSEHHLR